MNAKKNIRDMVGLSRREISEIGTVDGYPIQEVVKFPSGYYVRMGTGDMIPAKGHDSLDNLHMPKVARSLDVIQSYGEFGSSIGVPYRG